MKAFEECCSELSSLATRYGIDNDDPDAVFDVMEKIIDVCETLSSDYSEKTSELLAYTEDSSEAVRRVFSFCLLEYFSLSELEEDQALSVIVDFLSGSHGSQHVVWLTWIESWERRHQKKCGYTLRAALHPLSEDYAGKWLEITRRAHELHGFVSDTPEYPFDTFAVSDPDDSDDGADEFPY